MRIIFALIVAVISNSEIIAQTLSSGYIINLKRDTIHGFIADRTDKEMAINIKFTKEKDGSGLTKYAPAELLGMGFDNARVFERFSSVNKSGDSTSLFAKKIISGKIQLYTIGSKNNQPDMVLVNADLHRKVYLSEPKKQTMTVEKEEKKIFLVNNYLGLLAYVKNEPAMASQRLNYTEKSIKKDILNYNNQFAKDFPVTVYNPKLNYFYDVTFGMPVSRGGDSEFRFAIYKNKYSPEISRTFSRWVGVSYRIWSTDRPPDNVVNSNQNYRQQFISVIPLGLNFHSSAGVIRPYLYLGVGLACYLETNHNIVNAIDMGSKTIIGVFPTINPGAGVKIKIASQFLMIEVTPSTGSAAVFMNIGYSF